jgi:hypothetical protein
VKTNKLTATLTLFLTFLIACSASAIAQKRPSAPAATTKPPASLLLSLPQSDAVALINMRLLLDQAVPKIFAGNPEKLAEANAEIEKFKTKTGLNLRSCDQAAVGMRYTYPSPGIVKIETIVLAQGTFDTAAFATAGRAAASGKYREEKYQGHTIYLFTLDQQAKLLGLVNFKLHEVAVTALSSNVVALGTVNNVRGAIDAGKGPRGSNAELIALATKDPQAVIGLAGVVSPALLQSLKVGSDEALADLATIRQVYGSVGLGEKDVSVQLAAQTTSVAAAQNLKTTLSGLMQLGAFFVSQMTGPKGKLARTGLDNLKITTVGIELQLRTSAAYSDLAPLLR